MEECNSDPLHLVCQGMERNWDLQMGSGPVSLGIWLGPLVLTVLGVAMLPVLGHIPPPPEKSWNDEE
jgi:hypothetical protein